MKAQPPVSVIIPTYNRRQFVLEAIASVREQHYPAIEIIVVDDGSTDGTCEALSQLSDVKLVTQSNGGPSSARNAGLEQASSAWFTFLDSDDVWPKDRLRKLLGALDEKTDLVMGLVSTFGTDKIQAGDVRTGAYLGSGLFRREIFEVVGGFDVDRFSWEDLDWINRAREAGFVLKMIDQVTLLYRVHDHNMSSNAGASRRALLGVVHQSLVRRRGGDRSSNG